MNVYDCRFIDDEDKVTHIKQYGNSEKEIDLFWREWWPMHYVTDPSLGKYVDCEFVEVVKNYCEENERKNVESLLLMKENK